MSRRGLLPNTHPLRRESTLYKFFRVLFRCVDGSTVFHKKHVVLRFNNNDKNKNLYETRGSMSRCKNNEFPICGQIRGSDATLERHGSNSSLCSANRQGDPSSQHNPELGRRDCGSMQLYFQSQRCTRQRANVFCTPSDTGHTKRLFRQDTAHISCGEKPVQTICALHIANADF